MNAGGLSPQRAANTLRRERPGGESRPYVSVVVPLYNEAENVVDLHRELSRSLERLGRPYEVLLVDDGSRDDTLARLLGAHPT